MWIQVTYDFNSFSRQTCAHGTASHLAALVHRFLSPAALATQNLLQFPSDFSWTGQNVNPTANDDWTIPRRIGEPCLHIMTSFCMQYAACFLLALSPNLTLPGEFNYCRAESVAPVRSVEGQKEVGGRRIGGSRNKVAIVTGQPKPLVCRQDLWDRKRRRKSRERSKMKCNRTWRIKWGWAYFIFCLTENVIQPSH